MADGDQQHAPHQPPPEAGLSNSLLLQCLNELSAIGQRMIRTETQNEHIIAAQHAADRRQDLAEESRGTMHRRMNEISVNVAQVVINQDQQADRLDALDPIVTMLKDAHVERKTVRRVLRDLCKNGYAIGTVATAGGLGLWHQWENFKTIVLRALGAKIGGP